MSWNDMGAEIITTRHVERKHSTGLRDAARALSSLNRLFFRGVIMGLLLPKTYKIGFLGDVRIHYIVEFLSFLSDGQFSCVTLRKEWRTNRFKPTCKSVYFNKTLPVLG